MIHFRKGGNWEDGPMSFHVETKQDIEDTIVYGRVHDIEGLQDRWVKIIEMKTRAMMLLWMGGPWLENHEPEVDCVKEGLWVW